MSANLSTSPALAARWQAFAAPLRERWLALSTRDRLVAQWAGLGLGLLLLWFVLLQPALRTLREMPAKLAASELALQQMQALAAEARELRAQAAPPADQALAALQAATVHLGANARLSVAGERATLYLNGISPEQLQGWLSEARAGARTRPLEAKIERGPQGFSGTILLAMTAGGK